MIAGKRTKRVRGGYFAQILGKFLLQRAAEIKSAECDLFGGIHREEAVGINRFHADGDLLRSAGDHARQEETGEIIGDDYTGIFRKSGEQAFAGAGGWLNVGIVADAGCFAVGGILGHAFENEAMKAIASPGIANAQRFEDEERLIERGAMLEGAVEGKVVAQPTVGNHPVEDVGASRLERLVVGLANAN